MSIGDIYHGEKPSSLSKLKPLKNIWLGSLESKLYLGLYYVVRAAYVAQWEVLSLCVIIANSLLLFVCYISRSAGRTFVDKIPRMGLTRY